MARKAGLLLAMPCHGGQMNPFQSGLCPAPIKRRTEVMTPKDWTSVLRQENHWTTVAPVVATEIKTILDTLPPDAELSTRELVERLFPEQFAVGDGITARARLIGLVAGRKALDKSLLGYRHKVPSTAKRFGKVRTLMVSRWHARRDVTPPAGFVRCPGCGEIFQPDNNGETHE